MFATSFYNINSMAPYPYNHSVRMNHYPLSGNSALYNGYVGYQQLMNYYPNYYAYPIQSGHHHVKTKQSQPVVNKAPKKTKYLGNQWLNEYSLGQDTTLFPNYYSSNY